TAVILEAVVSALGGPRERKKRASGRIPLWVRPKAFVARSSGPDWSRTSTPLRPQGPQPCASANSAPSPGMCVLIPGPEEVWPDSVVYLRGPRRQGRGHRGRRPKAPFSRALIACGGRVRSVARRGIARGGGIAGGGRGLLRIVL